MFEDKVDILCQNLWKVFGSSLGSVLDTVNSGVTKQEVLEQNPEVLASPRVSGSVAVHPALASKNKKEVTYH